MDRVAMTSFESPTSNGNSRPDRNADTTELNKEAYRENGGENGPIMSFCCTVWPRNQSPQYKILTVVYIVSSLALLGISIGMLIESSQLQVEVSNVPKDWPYVTSLPDIGTLLSKDIYDIFIVAGALGVLSFFLAVLWMLCQKLILLKIFLSACTIFIILDITTIAVRHKLLKKDKTQFNSDDLKTALVQDVFDNYKEDVITGNENQSVEWNKLFIKMKCCGINPVPVGSRGDFEKSYWVRSGAAASQKIPTSCCINATMDSYTASTTCKDNVNGGTYHSEGCLSKLTLEYPVTLKYRDKAVGWIVAILIIHIMMCVMSIYFVVKGTEKFRKYKANKEEKANSLPDNVVCGK